MAKSSAFHWVEVNRDHTPEIPKRFTVSAYPSLLVLGDAEENIHRFQSFQEPEEFLTNLEEGLRRFALYRAGEPWSAPNERPTSITDEGELETFPAPSEGIPGGLTFVEGDLFVAQDKILRRLDLTNAAGRPALDVQRLLRERPVR